MPFSWQANSSSAMPRVHGLSWPYTRAHISSISLSSSSASCNLPPLYRFRDPLQVHRLRYSVAPVLLAGSNLRVVPTPQQRAKSTSF